MNPLSLGYEGFATKMSKNAIAAFTLVCIFVAVFKDWGFGIWWIAVWGIGIFVASLIVAPFVISEWFLLKNRHRKSAMLVSVIHTIGIFPVSYYLLKYAADWIYN